jgi:hypothetical protein
MLTYKNANLIITDPCYVLEEHYEDLLGDLKYDVPVSHSALLPTKIKGKVVGYTAFTNVGDGSWPTYAVYPDKTVEQIGDSCADAGLTCVIDIDELTNIGVVCKNDYLGTIIPDFTGRVEHYASRNGFTWILYPEDQTKPVIYAGDYDIETGEIPEGSYWITDPNNQNAHWFDGEKAYIEDQLTRLKEDLSTGNPVKKVPANTSLESLWDSPFDGTDTYVSPYESYDPRSDYRKAPAYLDLLKRLEKRYDERDKSIFTPFEVLERLKQILNQIIDLHNAQYATEPESFFNERSKSSYDGTHHELCLKTDAFPVRSALLDGLETFDDFKWELRSELLWVMRTDDYQEIESFENHKNSYRLSVLVSILDLFICTRSLTTLTSKNTIMLLSKMLKQDFEQYYFVDSIAKYVEILSGGDPMGYIEELFRKYYPEDCEQHISDYKRLYA